MADINIEMLKEKLYPAAKALFIIGETLVDESKMHISAEDAIKKIRSYMSDVDVISSRLRVDRLIGECMEPQVCNNFEKEQDEFLTKYLGKWAGLESLHIDYPSCCNGCSNNPKNGGSGICNCTLPYMQNPTNYTGTPNIGEYMYFTTSTDELQEHKANYDRIAQAKVNTERYLKRE